MSNTYLVNWSDEGIDEAQEIVSETAKGAYLQFIEENMHRSVSVSVWSEGEGSALDKFDEHIVDEPDEVESEESNFQSDRKIHVQSSKALEDKMDELIGLVRHIRLVLFSASFCVGLLLLAAQLQK
jgi:hypothetical protein